MQIKSEFLPVFEDKELWSLHAQANRAQEIATRFFYSLRSAIDARTILEVKLVIGMSQSMTDITSNILTSILAMGAIRIRNIFVPISDRRKP